MDDDEAGAADLIDAPDEGPPTGSTGAPGPRHAGSHRKKRDKAVVAKSKKPPRPFWVEGLVLLVVAGLIAVGVHTYLFQAFFIPSASMENTLHIGDRILVNRLSYKVGHVQRGQIVVFSGLDSWTPEGSVKTPHNPLLRAVQDVGSYIGFAPSGDVDYVKRVIGIPGDHVVCCDAQGRITVNGTPLNETYLTAGRDPTTHSTTTQVNESSPFDITVPAGHLWVEGDHRDDSGDSRAHTGDPGGGTIPINKVIGRVFLVVWPFSHARGVSVPSSYHGISGSVTASGLPSVVGLATVTPIGVLRRRRRRRLRTT